MKNKILALLALVMVFAVICTMSVAVFAHDHEDDTSSETTGETTGDTTDDSSDTTETKEPTWWDNNNQIIGWVVAGIILVAIVLVSIWWIRSGFKPSKK